MTSVDPEQVLYTARDPLSVQPAITSISIPSISVTNITYSGTIINTGGGGGGAGPVITTTSVDTLSNKSLVDNSTYVVDSADSTRKMLFNVSGTTGTLTTLNIPGGANAITFPSISTTLVGTDTSDTLANKNITSTSYLVDSSDNAKRLGWSINGASTGTTLTLASAHTTNRTVTFPNATTTLVGRDTTDTLTNKTLTHSTNALTDATDVTKQIKWNLAGATTGTVTTLTAAQTVNRTIVLPDASCTLVGNDTTQTLTNKTIGSGSNTVDATMIQTIPISGVAPTTNQALVYNGTSWAPAGIDHGTLAGLADDDHTQYLLVNGTRAMSGALNMGGFAISNVGNVDGVDISAHAARHLPNGADPLPVAAPVTIDGSVAVSSAGVAESFARSDHVHAVDLSTFAINSLSGTLGVTKGGTGATSLPAGEILQGGGTGAISSTGKIAPSGAIVGTTDVQTLTNKTLTSPVISNIVNVGIISVPTSTDTLVGKATTDTLTNKTLTHSTNVLADAADTTKQIKWSVSGGTTGTSTTLTFTQSTNRAITFPDASTTVVGTDVAQTLTNKTLTAPVISSISNTGTVTLPTATTTLVGRDTTDTLTNKTLTHTTNALADAADTTKQIKWSASGASTGTMTTLSFAQTTNRVITFPDATTTIVGTDVTQTLTNKTLTAPIIGTIVNSGILTLPTSSDTLVGRATTDTLTNKTLTAPVIATIVNSGTLTLPTSTDTIVGRATTDTLTNKTLTHSTNALADAADTTKQIKWNTSGATSGMNTTLTFAQTANRAITFPDATTTVVGTDVAQTLTNKTLSNPVISTISNGGTLTLPTSTDTLVGKATTDVLTNKTLTHSTNVLADGADTTKQIKWSVNGATTATATTLTFAQTANRTITFPDADTMVVGTDTTQTLTNKTLTAPVISTISNSGTVTIPAATTTLVGRDTTDTLTNKTLTAPVISTISNTGTLTLPTSTDTLVGKATTDVLTNKTLTHSTNALADAADTTKQVKWAASGATTSTATTLTFAQTANRVVTFPDATTTVVGTDVTQTLTNKTLTAPVISTISNSGTVTIPAATTTLVGRDTTDMLTNKTIGSAGNTVDATKLQTVNIASTAPSSGHLLRYNGTQWEPSAAWMQSISATAPIAYDNGTGVISATVGTTSGTLAAGNDARFTTPQLIHVKVSDAGAGEYTSVATAVASITDASISKPYCIVVGPGVYVESAFSMKSYVCVKGTSGATVLQAASNNSSFITAADKSYISDCQIEAPGAVSGSVLIRNVGGVFMVINCIFNTAYTITTVNSTLAPAVTFIRNCTSTAASGFNTFGTVTAVGGNLAILSVLNYVALATAVPYFTNFVSGTGSGALVQIANVFMRKIGSVSGTFATATNGCEMRVNNCTASGFATAIETTNTGSGPTIYIASMNCDACTTDLSLQHPSTSGTIDGTFARSKTSINASITALSLLLSDPSANNTTVVGDLFIGPTAADTIEISALIFHTTPMGLISGGALSDGGGFVVNVASGYGYASDGNVARKITWSNTSITLSASVDRFIYFTSGGTLTGAASYTNSSQIVLLGRVATNGTGIEFIDNVPNKGLHPTNYQDDYNRNAIGPIYDAGSIVTVNGSRQIAVTAGVYYASVNKYEPSGFSAGTSWRQVYGGTTLSNVTTVNNTQWDNAGVLTTMTDTYYVKHSFYVVGAGTTEKYYLVISQAEYSSLVNAEAADIPTPPSWFGSSPVLLATLIVQKNSASVTVQDQRPRIGFRAAGISAVSDHGNLTGLTDDDHQQYLLVSGSRAMAGALDMGGFAISNVGNVDGVDISGHAARHLPNGADPITSAAPITIDGTVGANSVGVANSFARSDHVHAVDLSTFAINSLSGTLGVTKGGTGATTFASGEILQGNGTSAISSTGKVAPTGAIVGTTDSQTLTNKTLTAPVISTISNTGTLTLPTSTDTLVGKATTDTLTNKTLTHTTNALADAADTTKQIKWAVSGATTGTNTTLTFAQTANRAITIPDATDTLIGRNTTDTLTNKTLTAPIIATISNGGTLTLPTSTDTLVGKATTDTLTNKTLTHSTNVLADAADTTKQVKWAASGATTATATTLTFAQTANRAITFPDATTTVVGTDVAQTLTNKTLTAPVIATISNTGTLTLPTSTDTLVGKATTDTLTNKTLTHSTNALADAADTTKQIKWATSGATTATATTLTFAQTANRAITFPDASTTIVGTDVAQTLTNKTLTAPVISTISNTGTLTLPTSTDTLVGKATTDTLTNKTLTHSTNVLADAADTTKQIKWSASGATTSTATTLTFVQTGNRAITFPDASTTVVGTDVAQTLTNKTLTAPVISTISNGGTLTLPTSTDTLVGKATTDTLTNKTLTHSTNALADVADTTKQVKWATSGATTSTATTLTFAQTTNRTITFPDASTTVVGTDVAQTLTNKTLTAPVISTISNSGTVTLPTATTTLVGRDTTDTLTNKTLTHSTNVLADAADTTKQIKWAAGGATTGTSTTLTFAQTADRVVTVPDATDTLIGRDTTDTLTNKTLTHSTNVLADAADTTKQVKWAVSGATTGTSTTLVFTQTTNRTITFPNSSSTVVLTDTTQTLTNKLLTLPTISQIQSGGGTLTLPIGITTTLVGRITTDTLTNKTLTHSTNALADDTDTTKQIRWAVSGATTGTNTTLTFAQTANRVITLPNATTTLVGTDTTDTLTNKTLTHSTNALADAADTTKQVKWATSGSTTGTNTTLTFAQTANRVITFPNATTTVVGTDVAQTLSAKAFSGTTNFFGLISSTDKVLLQTDNSAIDTTTQFIVRSASVAAKNFYIGLNTTSDYSYLQSTYTAVGHIPMALQPNGGPVLVGSTSSLLAGINPPTLEVSATPNYPAENYGGRIVAGSKAVGDAFFSAGLYTPNGTTKIVYFGANNHDLTAWYPANLQAAANLFINETSGTTVIGSSAVSTGEKLKVHGTFRVTGVATFDSSPVMSSITNSGTLTLPTSTDTIVGRATTDTLTNKTMTSTTNNVAAKSLHSASTVVNVSASAAPIAGQVLVATDSATAIWSSPYVGLYGSGLDGDVTISVNTNLTNDMYYNNLTVNTGVALRTMGYRVFVKGILTLNGTGRIHYNGNTATSNAVVAGLTTGTLGAAVGAAGGAGRTTAGVGSAGGSVTGVVCGGNGGIGGTSGANAGTATTASAGVAPANGGSSGSVISARAISGTRGLMGQTLNNVRIGGGNGGGGGASNGGTSGAGGGGGGWVVVVARRITGTGTISANGGNGANFVSGAAAGGGGGGGGWVVVVTSALELSTSNITANGGTGGTGSVGGASNGAAGSAGSVSIFTY